MYFSELSLQRGSDYIVNEKLSFKHPTLGEICDFMSENKVDYYSILSRLISNSLDYADILWVENKIWYEDIKSEWIFFLQTAICMAKKENLSFSQGKDEKSIEVYFLDDELTALLNFFLKKDGRWWFSEKKENNTVQNFLVNLPKNNKSEQEFFKFTEIYYNYLIEYLKEIHWVSIEYTFTRGNSRKTKQWILENNYEARKDREKKNKKEQVTIASINSSIVASGVSVSTWEMSLYFFNEIYNRLMKINEYKNTMSALYAGAIDTKKHPIDWEKINWTSVLKK